MDWDDYQLFLVVARAKSFVTASETLKLSYSTLARRIEGFEQRLGATLFIRQHGELMLTAEGQEVMAAAGKMSNTAASVERTLQGRNTKLEGDIVVTLSLSSLDILMPRLAEFQAEHPDIRLKFDTSRRFLDIMKGQADIAIRMTDNHEYRVPENLLGLRLPDVHVQAYADKKTAVKIKKGKPPEGLGWIRWDKRINFETMRSYFDRDGWPVTSVIDDIRGQVNAVKCGFGLGILPCFLGDVEPGIARISDRPPLPALDAWVLAHPDMRNVGRIRAFMQFAASCFEKNDALIRGLKPQK